MDQIVIATCIILFVIGYFTSDALAIAYTYIGSKRLAKIVKLLVHVIALGLLLGQVTWVLAHRPASWRCVYTTLEP